MKKTLILSAVAALIAGAAHAEGELNIYNWGNYTNPDLIKKFEETYDVKVTVTDYDSNTTALTKIEAGGHGFDIVVPTHSYVPIYIDKGLLMETRPDQMDNFKNMDTNWVNVDWDKGRHYTVPWQWGSTGVAVNMSAYSGDVNTSAIFLDPPAELAGKVNVVPEMTDIVKLAIYYVGGTDGCTEDKEILKKARDVLVAAKPKWLSMDYGTTDKLSSGEWVASVNWNGSTFRARLANDKVKYGYPVEGYPLWMDSVGVLADAKNVENAKLFQNFIMDPENAAMISAFARYSNGIMGSSAYMPDDMKTAPEINPPAELAAAGKFSPSCSKAVQDIHTAIWTELQK
ncbi:MAG: extracellular solute-binding protein [Rhodobacteraceae bacterium]|nr:extracellular solute-binding protein [Paracoccaceae bacterium]